MLRFSFQVCFMIVNEAVKLLVSSVKDKNFNSEAVQLTHLLD